MTDARTVERLDTALRRHGIEDEAALLGLLRVYLERHGERATALLHERGQRLVDAAAKDDVLARSLELVVDGDPTGSDLPTWYQHLIGRRFRKGSGKFFTPRPVANAMARLVPREARVVLDPTCGGGTFLVEAARVAGRGRRLTLVGHDIEPTLLALAHVVLTLGARGHEHRLSGGDLYEREALREWRGKGDAILANPPFSLRLEGVACEGPLFALGYRTSDALFVDVCHELLRPGGRLVCLLPHSLVANDDFAAFRRSVEERWTVRGVIGLPEGVFHLTASTTTRADIVVLDKGAVRAPRRVFAFAPSVGVSLGRRGGAKGDALGELVRDAGVRASLGRSRGEASGVPASDVVPGRWEATSRAAGCLADHATVARPRRHEGPALGPIEYRDLPSGASQTFALGGEVTSAGPVAGEEQLLFGTLRAYLGNVLVTPRAGWLDRAGPIAFALRSEFLVVEPRDGLRFFWLAYLRKSSFLSRLPLGTGGTRPRLTAEALLATPVSVPPLAERRALDARLRSLAEAEWRRVTEQARLVASLGD